MLSYSLHISNGKHAITTKSKLQQSLKHNLRSYKSEHYSKDNIVVIHGQETAHLAYKDCDDFYRDKFALALQRYNNKQTRDDRKIACYLDHISDKKNQDIAVEIIIQVGSKDDWEFIPKERQKLMTVFYENQLKKLGEQLPDFKILSAVVHYDEASPHMQIIGVPIKDGCKRGLEKQVSKRSVFTKEVLTELQAEMRKGIEDDLEKIFDEPIALKPKEKGRNIDFTVKEYKAIQNEIALLKGQKGELIEQIHEVKEKFSEFKNPYENNYTEVLNICKNIEEFLQSCYYVRNYILSDAHLIGTTLQETSQDFSALEPKGIGNIKRVMITEDFQRDVIYFLDKAQKSNEVLVKKFSNSDYYWSGSDLKMNFYELFQTLFEKLKNLLLTLIQENTKLAILPDENKKKAEFFDSLQKDYEEMVQNSEKEKQESFNLGYEKGLKDGKDDKAQEIKAEVVEKLNLLFQENRLGKLSYDEDEDRIAYTSQQRLDEIQKQREQLRWDWER